ncbi:MAG: hypothetical protein JO189_25750 [Deltaproteobacteria bacterium]|nr:hypothetical protein [Deltaproteobacteria bacterium]
MEPAPLRQRPACAALERRYEEVKALHLRDLFVGDRKRGERMAAGGAGTYLDYSKNRITDETLRLLLELAESGLWAHIDAMVSGEKINVTEGRSVPHVALRAPREASFLVDGENVVPKVHVVLDKMRVELGEVLAQQIIPELGAKGEPALSHDSSTNILIRRYRKLKETST